MLRSIKDMEGYAVKSGDDGVIGTVHSLLFRDVDWKVRYIVVDTGKWIPGRRVLVRPGAVKEADGVDQLLRLSMTQEGVERSPDLDDIPPVSRQREIEHRGVLQSMALWEPAGVPANVYLDPSMAVLLEEGEDVEEAVETDPHLRSTLELEGYEVHALDGQIGHVREFIVDTGAVWTLQYAVVNTGTFLTGKDALVHVSWMTDIDWKASAVRLDLTKKSVEGAPDFDPKEPVNREFEDRLFDYYGRPVYY